MSNFGKGQATNLTRIAHTGLRYFNDLLCKNFGDGIGPVAELESTQALFIGRSQRSAKAEFCKSR